MLVIMISVIKLYYVDYFVCVCMLLYNNIDSLLLFLALYATLTVYNSISIYVLL